MTGEKDLSNVDVRTDQQIEVDAIMKSYLVDLSSLDQELRAAIDESSIILYSIPTEQRIRVIRVMVRAYVAGKNKGK